MRYKRLIFFTLCLSSAISELFNVTLFQLMTADSIRWPCILVKKHHSCVVVLLDDRRATSLMIIESAFFKQNKGHNTLSSYLYCCFFFISPIYFLSMNGPYMINIFSSEKTILIVHPIVLLNFMLIFQ